MAHSANSSGATLAARAATWGPGVIFALSAVGPQDFITNSIAGSTHGYSLIWLLVVAVAARYVILEASSRYVIATGESIVAGCKRVNRSLPWLLFVAPLVKRHFAGLSQALLLGVAAHVALPLPTPHSATVWSLVSWTLGFGLIYWGRYRWIERFSQGMAVFFGACLALAAILAKPQPAAVFEGIFLPSLPDNAGVYGSTLVIVAVLGGAAGSFSNLRYAAFVHEKGWRDPSHMRSQRSDLLASMFGILLMLTAIQIAAAGALRPGGLQVERVEDLAPIFGLVLGDAGRILLAAGLWSAVFNNHVGATAGYSLMLAETYHRFIRPSSAIGEQETGRGAAYLPSYRWFLAYFCLGPLYVFFTDWKPVWLVLVNSAVGVIMLPAMIMAVLRLTADKRLLGDYANGPATNAALGITLAAALYLAGQGVFELFAAR